MAAYSQGFRSSSDNSPAWSHTDGGRLRILLVADENSLLHALRTAVNAAGYNLCLASTGAEALRKCQSARHELILLELILSDMDGKELLRSLRKWTSAPVIVVSARNDESEIVACLDAGADDYLTIPIAAGELMARIRSALRRAFGSAQSEVFKAGDFRVDFNRREVFVGDDHVKLTSTEYDLLTVLVRHAGLVIAHYQLIHEVWGGMQYGDAVHLLRVTVSNLRRKLASEHRIHRLIVTEPRVGYRIRSDSHSAQMISLTPL